MPTRMIREGWLESEAVNTLDPQAERFFLRLILRADDFGRYHANPLLLKSNLFPLREDVRSTDIPRWLAACEKAGLVRCYEADAKPFLHVVKFGQRVKDGSKSKFPEPPAFSGKIPEVPGSDGKFPPHSESKSEPEANSKGLPAADCAEPQAAAAPAIPPPEEDAIVLVFPVVGAPGVWHLRDSKLREYRATFPAFDVEAELRTARQWCVDNPSRQKTAKGMTKFLFAWLERRQNRNGGVTAQQSKFNSAFA